MMEARRERGEDKGVFNADGTCVGVESGKQAHSTKQIDSVRMKERRVGNGTTQADLLLSLSYETGRLIPSISRESISSDFMYFFNSTINFLNLD